MPSSLLEADPNNAELKGLIETLAGRGGEARAIGFGYFVPNLSERL